MDTRTKILTSAMAAALEPVRPLVLMTGRFDILRAEMVRELSDARRRTAAQTLMAVVLPMSGELAPLASRTEMAAALRVVDYVLIAGNEDLERLADSLQPIEIIHLDEADTRRTRQLIEHVQSRQS